MLYIGHKSKGRAVKTMQCFVSQPYNEQPALLELAKGFDSNDGE